MVVCLCQVPRWEIRFSASVVMGDPAICLAHAANVQRTENGDRSGISATPEVQGGSAQNQLASSAPISKVGVRWHLGWLVQDPDQFQKAG